MVRGADARPSRCHCGKTEASIPWASGTESFMLTVGDPSNSATARNLLPAISAARISSVGRRYPDRPVDRRYEPKAAHQTATTHHPATQRTAAQHRAGSPAYLATGAHLCPCSRGRLRSSIRPQIRPQHVAHCGLRSLECSNMQHVVVARRGVDRSGTSTSRERVVRPLIMGRRGDHRQSRRYRRNDRRRMLHCPRRAWSRGWRGHPPRRSARTNQSPTNQSPTNQSPTNQSRTNQRRTNRNGTSRHPMFRSRNDARPR
jgi:hypothetical protein